MYIRPKRIPNVAEELCARGQQFQGCAGPSEESVGTARSPGESEGERRRARSAEPGRTDGQTRGASQGADVTRGNMRCLGHDRLHLEKYWWGQEKVK